MNESRRNISIENNCPHCIENHGEKRKKKISRSTLTRVYFYITQFNCHFGIAKVRKKGGKEKKKWKSACKDSNGIYES